MADIVPDEGPMAMDLQVRLTEADSFLFSSFSFLAFYSLHAAKMCLKVHAMHRAVLCARAPAMI